MSLPTTHAIVGREPELQRLRAVVESTARPVVAFLEGDAGVGKTALLESVVAEAAAAGTRVLRARPTAAEAASSFAVLDDLLRPAIEGLPRLAEPQRRALGAALLLEAATDPVDPRLAVAPGTALAMPESSLPPSSDVSQPIIDPPPAPEVREIRSGDSTLPLIFSGTALLIAAGGLGLAGRDHQRIRHIIQ